MTQDTGRPDDGSSSGSPDPGTPWWSRPGGSPWDPPQAEPAATPAPAPAPAPAAIQTQPLFPAPPFPQAPLSYGGNGHPVDTLGHGGPEHRPRSLGLVLALATLVGLIAGLAGGAGGYLLADRADNASTTLDGAKLDKPPTRSADRPPGSVAGVANKVLPSVVQIKVQTNRGGGTGSGFVIDEDGLILTNNHVVDGADSQGVQVSFQDGTTAPADVVGASASYDLAVLKIDAKNLEPLPLGDSDASVVGDPVIAIGSPLGLSGTVTSGIVSAKDRPVTAGRSDRSDDSSYINAIQTDAAINPGNSGGPLVNLEGEVIGVNSSIATLGGGMGEGGGNIGVGFAIPINQARRTAEQIIDTGSAQFPVMGASLDSAYEGEGARIAGEPAPDGTPPIRPDGPADQAGLRAGDIIVKIDDKPVAGSRELIVAIRSKTPGDRITLTIRRNGSEETVEVTLGASKG